MRRQTSRSGFIALFAISLIGFLLTGCGSNESPAGVDLDLEEGSLAIGISVAETGLTKSGPDPAVIEGIAELYITFDSILAYRAPDDCDTALCDSTGGIRHRQDGDAEEIEIIIDPVTVEILELGNTLTALVAEASLPEGRYVKLTLGLSGAWAVADDGQIVPVSVPPHGDPLLNVIAPFEIIAGETVAIVLEVDLENSIRELPPGSGELYLAPVLRGDLAPGGSVGGWHRGDHEQGGMNGQGDGQGGSGPDDADRGSGDHGPYGDGSGDGDGGPHNDGNGNGDLEPGGNGPGDGTCDPDSTVGSPL